MNVILVIISYLLGAVPFGLVIGKCVGADVRKKGSKNIGATNVSRLLGKKLGFLTLLCDLLKGFLPIVAGYYLLPPSDMKITILASCGLAAVIGHMFPVYLGFKGGKGVATGLGVFLFFSPPAIGISLIVFVVSVVLSGFVSVGSLTASALIPLWIFLFGLSREIILLAVVIAALIWIKHRENIMRLVRGEEKSWKKKK